MTKEMRSALQAVKNMHNVKIEIIAGRSPSKEFIEALKTVAEMRV